MLCLRMLSSIPLQINVVECDVQGAPEHIVGTPSLEEGHDVFTGHEAIHRLFELALQRASETASVERNESSGSRARDRQQRPQPLTTAPPKQNDDVDTNEDDAWTISHATGDDEEDVDVDRKITADDLARAMAKRRSTIDSASASTPPPPPPPAVAD